MQGNEQLSIIIPMLNDVADGIRTDQLTASTPCTDFSVDGVLHHMTQLGSQFAPMFGGAQPDAADVAPPGESSVDAFHRAMNSLLVAVQAPGALDRTIESPAGPMPGTVFAKLVAFDGIIHGWDLATATGQAWDPPDALVADLDAFARGAIPSEMRSGAGFGPEQQPAAGAGPLDRLVAFSGRAT